MAKFLILFFILISQASFGISIISDLDDTVKVTNVNNKPRALFNALFSKKAFEGVPTVINKLVDEQSKLYIVSASPNLFSKKILEFLDYQNLDYHKVYLRKISELGKKREYKLRVIREILNDNPDDFIFIGDNTELDDEVYHQIKDEFPTRVKAIYIHQIVKDIKTESVPFFTAYDIGLNEAKEGRLNYLEVGKVALEMLKPGYLNKVFPSFKYCPKKSDVFEQDIPFLLRKVSKQVFNKVVSHCKK